MDINVLTIQLLCFSQSEGHFGCVIQKLWNRNCLISAAIAEPAAIRLVRSERTEAAVNLAMVPRFRARYLAAHSPECSRLLESMNCQES